MIRGGGAVMVQAGSTAVLLGTVEPNAPDLAGPRTANALAAHLELLQASGMTKIEADRTAGVCEHRTGSRPHPNEH